MARFARDRFQSYSRPPGLESSQWNKEPGHGETAQVLMIGGASGVGFNPRCPRTGEPGFRLWRVGDLFGYPALLRERRTFSTTGT